MTDKNEWVDWAGGDCPVQSHLAVRVIYRDGLKWTYSIAGAAQGWDHREDDPCGDIIAYRITENPT